MSQPSILAVPAVGEEARKHLHRGRFPRAVRAEKTDNLASLNFKAYVIHSPDAAVMLG
jgi:hypothetical protein